MNVGRRRIGSLVVGFVVIATSGCGPGIETAGMSGGASEAGTASGSASDTDPSNDTGSDVPFSCTSYHELVPGYCFERYDIELPGPLVMERAVGADIDGDGDDALALELELDGVKMLTIWDFDDQTGAVLDQEVSLEDPPPEYGDFEGTKLLAGAHLPEVDWMPGRPEPSGVESIYRTGIERISLCEAQQAPWVLRCEHHWAYTELPDPIVLGHTVSCCGGMDVATTASQSTLGLELYAGNLGRIGHIYSTPPCETPIALAYGDIDGNGRGDIVYRSSAECLEEDDPKQRDVGAYLFTQGEANEPAPFVAPDIDTDLLLTLDVDLDGTDEVLAAESSMGGLPARYRVLSWADPDAPSWTEAMGPERVERLERADLRGDGSVDVVYVEARTHLASSPFEPAAALPTAFGRLLAVVDANGDGLDDLLMAGDVSDSSIVLLVSR